MPHNPARLGPRSLAAARATYIAHADDIYAMDSHRICADAPLVGEAGLFVGYRAMDERRAIKALLRP
jgi:hypothetical protein